MTYKIRNIAVAGVLAVLAVLLTLAYVVNYKRDVQRGAEEVTVYVARKDIPAGTAGAEIVEKGLLEKKNVARDAVARGALSEQRTLRRLVVTEGIYRGEQVTARRFAPLRGEGVRSLITGNLRVFQLPGNGHQLLAGTLEEGDRVDVVGTWSVDRSDRKVSGIVLRGIRVLEPASGDASSSTGEESASVTLALTDRQAQRLFWITKNGEWTLQLRPFSRATDRSLQADNAQSLLRGGADR